MALREIESTLPPGFRFYPSDEELVCHYLHKKVANERIAQGTLVEVDLHAREPWELPEVAKLTACEWYFFSFRDRKYATGSRTNRATRTGYWKATGKDREVRRGGGGGLVGMRKTLVFYQGRAPNGVKTCWVMHEFRLDAPHSPPREDWVLCRVFQKRRVDGGDGDGLHDGAGASSPRAFAGSPAHVTPDYPAAAAAAGYYDLQAGFETPRQDQAAGDGGGGDVPHYYYYGGGGAGIDHHQGLIFPQDACGGVLPAFGTRRAGDDEYGFNGYYDMGFEDVADLAGMRFPQVWD